MSGRSTAGKLHERGIATVGQAAELGEAALISMLGRASGRHLHALAHNLDPRRVRAGRRRGSFGSQCALGRSPRSPDAIDAVLIGLVDRVTRRMRASGRAGRTVSLRLRFADFTRATRSRTLSQATAATATVLVAARTLLAAATPTIERRGLTLLGVAVSNLDARDVGVQLALPLDRFSTGGLDAALDELRTRFGPDAVTRAALLRSGSELSPWLLPGDQPRRAI